MKKLKQIIYCTVTNDLNYDQRMQRICTTLAVEGGYRVVLVGRSLPTSKPLFEQVFEQKRLNCWAKRGKFFYIEYNIRLFFFLLFRRFDAVCSVDLDTILAGSYAAWFRRKACIYDAHELFTEVPEVVARPRTQRIWAWVARHTIPKTTAAYTVCESLAAYFEAHYKRKFGLVRNLPFALKRSENEQILPTGDAPIIMLYQGALNDGRGIGELLSALPNLSPRLQLWLAGEGDLSQDLRAQTEALGLQNRVKFFGFVAPVALKNLTAQCHIGLNLLENKGLNYYYSLANKFFDYIQAEKPALNMDFPEYRHLCAQYPVGALLADLSQNSMKDAVNQLLTPDFYAACVAACTTAREVFTWENEAPQLLAIYAQAMPKKA
jgi:glycosyltransferase involved in cell wall biosynthesis